MPRLPLEPGVRIWQCLRGPILNVSFGIKLIMFQQFPLLSVVISRVLNTPERESPHQHLLWVLWSPLSVRCSPCSCEEQQEMGLGGVKARLFSFPLTVTEGQGRQLRLSAPLRASGLVF